MIAFKYVVLDFKADSSSSVELMKERDVFTELSKMHLLNIELKLNTLKDHQSNTII